MIPPHPGFYLVRWRSGNVNDKQLGHLSSVSKLAVARPCQFESKRILNISQLNFSHITHTSLSFNP